jgi:hypothetical protein
MLRTILAGTASTLVALAEKMAMNSLMKSGAVAICLMIAAASAGDQGIETIAAYAAGGWSDDRVGK